MAIFKQNATDKYVSDATFLYENDLEKTVKLPSTHTHKSNLSWSTDSQIYCKAPEIIETYTNVVKICKVLEFYIYASKSAKSPANFAVYGYSMNVSLVYLNTSSVTFNRGRHFLLPSQTRVHFGAVQVKIGKVDAKKDRTKWSNGGFIKHIQALYVTTVKGQRIQP